jgi:sulfite reductase alpha subunit-like flavoprotein
LGASNAVLVPLIRCERVTSSDHFQDTRLVEFDISRSGLAFSPGDVCMIQPSNLDEVVERFVKLFSHFDADKVFQLVKIVLNFFSLLMLICILVL